MSVTITNNPSANNPPSVSFMPNVVGLNSPTSTFPAASKSSHGEDPYAIKDAPSTMLVTKANSTDVKDIAKIVAALAAMMPILEKLKSILEKKIASAQPAKPNQGATGGFQGGHIGNSDGDDSFNLDDNEYPLTALMRLLGRAPSKTRKTDPQRTGSSGGGGGSDGGGSSVGNSGSGGSQVRGLGRGYSVVDPNLSTSTNTNAGFGAHTGTTSNTSSSSGGSTGTTTSATTGSNTDTDKTKNTNTVENVQLPKNGSTISGLPPVSIKGADLPAVDVKDHINKVADAYMPALMKTFNCQDPKQIKAFLLGVSSRESAANNTLRTHLKTGDGAAESYGPLQTSLTAWANNDHPEWDHDTHATDIPQLDHKKFGDDLDSNILMGIRHMCEGAKRGQLEGMTSTEDLMKAAMAFHNTGHIDAARDDNWVKDYGSECFKMAKFYARGDNLSNEKTTYTNDSRYS